MAQRSNLGNAGAAIRAMSVVIDELCILLAKLATLLNCSTSSTLFMGVIPKTAMNLVMLSNRQDNQILKSIIKAISVNVVDNFLWTKTSTKMLLHCVTSGWDLLTQSISSGNSDIVTILINASILKQRMSRTTSVFNAAYLGAELSKSFGAIVFPRSEFCVAI